MLTNRTPEAHAWAVKKFKTFQSGGLFFPYSMGKINVMLPGQSGGGEWGGPAIDPKTGIIYINAIEMAWIGGFTSPHPGESVGEKIYQAQCSVCHGQDRAGSPPTFPSLVDIDDRLTDAEIEKTIHQGRGRMPAFNNIDDRHIRALIRYLETGGKNGDLVQTAANFPTAPRSPKSTSVANENQTFEFTGFQKFLDPEGYPAISPPWGTLNAINLKTGRYLWKIPFGEYPELAAKGMRNTGTESYGGPIVTAGGLVFIGATVFDQKFHAFDSRTGKLLWETKLPFSGLATPATYMVNGKQYVVIASGGGQSSRKPSGGLYIAFALP
jgi:quinoprotein glucose dehydrogenase